MKRAWRLLWAGSIGLACVAFSAARPASGQALPTRMTLVLIDDAGMRSEAYAPLGGTVVISRTDPGHAGGGTSDQVVADRLDVAFQSSILSNRKLLEWVAKGGDHAAVELTVGEGKGTTVYRMSGITSRNITTTQSQDGGGQASLVLAAQHATIGGVSLN